jgi:hypothetical protein
MRNDRDMELRKRTAIANGCMRNDCIGIFIKACSASRPDTHDLFRRAGTNNVSLLLCKYVSILAYLYTARHCLHRSTRLFA